jgi:natural product biosynthesis luciferase-like monooxygenase protein
MDLAWRRPGYLARRDELSFDISVLELLWTLTRGFTVVLHRDETRGGVGHVTSRVARDIDFSLFYFSSDESGNTRSKYRLLLEGARFADHHGFVAVWTPERHFHAFGGLYPNPSVTGAAIATITERIQIRAGSCVLPLHHPARVAEEWSVVDNLSNGRVGLSFAAGWQPNDFLLRPSSWGRAKEAMFEEIDVVRRLWRGDAVEFPGATGSPVTVRTLPRPVQPELPFWVTTAGNPATFEQAGGRGANLLTHLLGQTLEELRDKIRLYRESRQAAGTGRGVVSLMLHTFVGRMTPPREAVRGPDRVPAKLGELDPAIRRSFPPSSARGRPPLKWTLPGWRPRNSTRCWNTFERYYQTSGLFGTPDAMRRHGGRSRR